MILISVAISLAGAQYARLLTLRGQVGEGAALLAQVTDTIEKKGHGLELCDVAIASADVYDVIQMFSGPVAQFKACVKLTEQFGDEPRRAQLCAHLAHFLTYAHQFEEGWKYLEEAEVVAQRLRLRPLALACMAVRGLLLVESRTSAAEAVRVLSEVAAQLRERDNEPVFIKQDILQPGARKIEHKGHAPLRCRVLLDLTRAAVAASDTKVIKESLHELERLAWEHFFGYCPHYFLAHAECVLNFGEGDVVREANNLIDRALKVSEEANNPWFPELAENFRRQMKPVERDRGA